MSGGFLAKIIVLFYALALMLQALSAHAEDMPRQPTIADCPAGYTLGVELTDQPQPLIKTPDNKTPKAIQETTEEAVQKTAEAPRAFVTGCIPKSTQQ